MNAPLRKPVAGMLASGSGNPGNATTESRLSAMLELEGEVRLAQSRDALALLMVNETRRVVPQAARIFAFLDEPSRGRFVLTHATGISAPDARAPAVVALNQVLADALRAQPNATRPFVLNLSAGEQETGLSLRHLVLAPLVLMGGRTGGWLTAALSSPPQESDLIILERVTGTYGHALTLFASSQRRDVLRHAKGRIAMATCAAVLFAMAIPVPLSALAPAEIIARDPHLVAAPLSGVIRTIPVEPNSMVRQGDRLIIFDTTELAGKRETAARALDVAAARERRARQGAFSSPEMRHELAIAQAERQVAEAELAQANEILARATITAARDGILIFTRRDDWIGTPVTTGERIMQIASPGKVQLRIELATGDAGVLEGNGKVRLFLDHDPLKPVAATITSAGHLTETTADNRLVYMVMAAFQPGDEAGLRTGLRGTAQISGPDVLLGFYLFRRPISMLRQRFGL